jgi:hypothetical protein
VVQGDIQLLVVLLLTVLLDLLLDGGVEEDDLVGEVEKDHEPLADGLEFVRVL